MSKVDNINNELRTLVKRTNVAAVGIQMAFDDSFTLEEKAVYYILCCLPETWNLTIQGVMTMTGLSKNKTGDVLNKFRKYGYLQTKKKSDGGVISTLNMTRPLREEEIEAQKNTNNNKKEVEKKNNNESKKQEKNSREMVEIQPVPSISEATINNNAKTKDIKPDINTKSENKPHIKEEAKIEDKSNEESKVKHEAIKTDNKEEKITRQVDNDKQDTKEETVNTNEVKKLASSENEKQQSKKEEKVEKKIDNQVQDNREMVENQPLPGAKESEPINNKDALDKAFALKSESKEDNKSKQTNMQQVQEKNKEVQKETKAISQENKQEEKKLSVVEQLKQEAYPMANTKTNEMSVVDQLKNEVQEKEVEQEYEGTKGLSIVEQLKKEMAAVKELEKNNPSENENVLGYSVDIDREMVENQPLPEDLVSDNSNSEDDIIDNIQVPDTQKEIESEVEEQFDEDKHREEMEKKLKNKPLPFGVKQPKIKESFDVKSSKNQKVNSTFAKLLGK